MLGHHWAKSLQFYQPILPKNKAAKVKRGLKPYVHALRHFGQRVDESPMYEDVFGVSWSQVSLLVCEKSRFQKTLIFGQNSHCFFPFV